MKVYEQDMDSPGSTESSQSVGFPNDIGTTQALPQPHGGDTELTIVKETVTQTESWRLSRNI